MVCARGQGDNSLGKHAFVLEILDNYVNIDVLKKRIASLSDKRYQGEGLAAAKSVRVVNIPSVNNGPLLPKGIPPFKGFQRVLTAI